MGHGTISWESLLETQAPAECFLKAALFTTYDRADERFVVEHLLPLFLKLGHEHDGESAERQYFLLELDRRLQEIHDRIVIVSSTAREEPPASDDRNERPGATYDWIWRSIRHLTVGSARKAVQHSKLWLVHWGSADADTDEYLEIVISSANLTRPAFQSQLQAGWRACIALQAQRSETRLAKWGVLPAFLEELGKSTGEPQRVRAFTELLARVECPKDATFLASVPGMYSRKELRRRPWGAAGLARIVPAGKSMTTISVISPYVGWWTLASLRRWCAEAGGSPHRLELVWIDKDHAWTKYWCLPRSTAELLMKSKDSIRRYKNESGERVGFHEEHRAEDPRWCHAKLYHLRRGNSRRLLITSANFSTAAWGNEDRNGVCVIENFELGVCVPVDPGDWPFDNLECFENANDIATVEAVLPRSSNLIAWANAAWDGKTIRIDCRCAQISALSGELRAGSQRVPVKTWRQIPGSGMSTAKVAYSGSWEPPFVIDLKCLSEHLSVPIFDERSQGEREMTLPPEVDAELALLLRDQLLFEQYGGRIALEDPDTDVPDADGGLADGEIEGAGDENGSTSRSHDSYAVPSFELARQHFDIVNNWAARLERSSGANSEALEREWLRRDGELLLNAFKRKFRADGTKNSSIALPSRLADEELAD